MCDSSLRAFVLSPMLICLSTLGGGPASLSGLVANKEGSEKGDNRQAEVGRVWPWLAAG